MPNHSHRCSSGTDWNFPTDIPIPGQWDEADGDKPSNSSPGSGPSPRPTTPTPNKDESESHNSTRQCRICLETVPATYHFASSAPNSTQPTPSQQQQQQPRVTYESPPGSGGRLLRPCRCKGSQQYVHEECLTAWRMADPLHRRHYWQCPTCLYRYRLQRLAWSSYVRSTTAQVALTVGILLLAVFALGFVADPIINLYLDPIHTIVSAGDMLTDDNDPQYQDPLATWSEHFAKGLASLGLLGFAKFLLTLSPLNWLNLRGSGLYASPSGGITARRAGMTSGRDRMAQISWIAIAVGVATFLYAVWQSVRAWSRRTLERAGDRVLDVEEE